MNSLRSLVGKLQDLAEIAGDPIGSFRILARQAGFEGKPRSLAFSERVTTCAGELFSWLIPPKPHYLDFSGVSLPDYGALQETNA